MSAACVLAVSSLAWLAWVPVSHAAAGRSATLPLYLLESFLAVAFVSGLESVVVGLLPMRFLDGARIMEWNRKVWAVLFGIGALAFVHILLRPGSGYVNHASHPSLLTVAIVPVGFGVFTFGFWAFFRLRKESEAEVADQERVGLPDDELVESSPVAGE